VDVDDDFVLNTGDSITGELVGSRAGDSRLFTAQNTTTGDRLSIRSTTGDEFEIVGYNSSAGVWNDGSALSYDPSSEDWSFGALPDVNGDTIATRTWVDNQSLDAKSFATEADIAVAAGQFAIASDTGDLYFEDGK
jgi:hypothetical protein